jgi:hypothetical protein
LHWWLEVSNLINVVLHQICNIHIYITNNNLLSEFIYVLMYYHQNSTHKINIYQLLLQNSPMLLQFESFEILCLIITIIIIYSTHIYNLHTLYSYTNFTNFIYHLFQNMHSLHFMYNIYCDFLCCKDCTFWNKIV